MIVQALLKLSRPFLGLLPEKTRSEWRQTYYATQQTRQSAHLAHTQPLETWLGLVEQNPYLESKQKASEIIQLLTLIQQMPAQYVCEIGTSKAGTLFLLLQASAPNATVVSMDLAIPLKFRLPMHVAKQSHQHLHLFTGDSHSAKMVERLQKKLKGHTLDVLFIDGDHSYAGVKADFEQYAPLVRKGGIVALHDIVPDYAQTKGITTYADSGEVPHFWQEIKTQYRYTELIEASSQDGYGIGVLHV
jgi:predicted O-methyltransferase YrrM